MTTGRVHSVETLGALDGPGLRCVVFLQGCPLRCQYCHNPDTWDPRGGKEMTAADVLSRVMKYRRYFGEKGGVTLSGGEPLMQAQFAADVLRLCQAEGIHTAVDTAGYRLDADVQRVLDYTRLVILDIKHADPQRYKELSGGELSTALEFMAVVCGRGIPLWVRQVIVPGLNDNEADIRMLAGLLAGAGTLAKAELLAYHAMARGKWEQLGREYPLADVRAADSDRMTELQQLLESLLLAHKERA